MKQGLCWLLVLLVVSAVADDAWAAATPDPDDDVLAARDNDFTLSARPFQPKGRDKDAPSPGGPGASLAHLSLPAAAPACLLQPPAAASGGPSLVYLFKSLRR
jgi:hypothetical protein